MSFKIYNEDCLSISRRFRTKTFDLIYLDPPFGTGSIQGLNNIFYDDTVEGDDYLIFLKERLRKIIPYLSDDGFFLIHLDKHAIYEVKTLMDQFGIPFKGDLIWCYRRWSTSVQSLQKNHDTILVYSFNRNYTKKRNLISQSIVAPSSKERVGYPTQKPVKLLKRIITDLDSYTSIASVLDPFMGSGTTLVAAKELGKEAYGFDSSEKAYKIAKQRLNNTERNILEFKIRERGIELQ